MLLILLFSSSVPLPPSFKNLKHSMRTIIDHFSYRITEYISRHATFLFLFNALTMNCCISHREVHRFRDLRNRKRKRERDSTTSWVRMEVGSAAGRDRAWSKLPVSRWKRVTVTRTRGITGNLRQAKLREQVRATCFGYCYE